jgi:Amt family ammonium transporter
MFSAADTIWVLLASILVFFMQAGFGIMFGTDVGGLLGRPDFFVQGDYSTTFHTTTFLMFQTVFCATAATIVSGAMAERTKFAWFGFNGGSTVSATGDEALTAMGITSV